MRGGHPIRSDIIPGGLLDVERGALVPASALKIKIAQLFGMTS
jgi:hypothetical protein